MRVLILLAIFVALFVYFIGSGISTRVTVSEHTTTIGGEINEETIERFRVRPLIVTTGPGGMIEPALGIGTMIRRARADTIVPYHHSCASACALIWLAGTRRYLGGAVGFHPAHYGGTDIYAEESNQDVADYCRWLGMPERFIRWVDETDTRDISWLTPRLAQELGVPIYRP
jgi:hypothetical protein